ncbi:MAG: hypothetical protein ACYC7L_15630 [Nitrospirota bacterium]
MKVLTETQGRVLLMLVSVVVSLAVAEGAARLRGFEPWTYLSTDTHEPSVFEYDPVLGWKAVIGNYIDPPYDPTASATHLSILRGMGRRTSKGQTDVHTNRPKMVFVGCSFTMGWAINDEDTFPWKLQTRHPSYEVLNYGVAGYGTYQSLLILERELPELRDPKIVVYGFIENHEERNVATANWMEWLSSYSHRHQLDFPFVTVDKNGKLRRHRPVNYPRLPFRENMAIVALLEKALGKFEARGRDAQGREATQQLILEMKAVSARNGAEFVLALLDYSEAAKAGYMEFARKNTIRVADCEIPEYVDDLAVPGEGHPNGKANTLWAQCISEFLLRSKLLKAPQ